MTVTCCVSLQVQVYLYMGLSSSTRASADTESSCSPRPLATGQQTDLSPSPPVGKKTSWRNLWPQPQIPALKMMCLHWVSTTSSNYIYVDFTQLIFSQQV